jgi:hypothetical protein
VNLNNNSNTTKFLLGLCFDALGCVSFAFPLFDVIWAPLSAYLMIQMYDGKKGRIAGVVVFIEEALPVLDVIPTFTIMWIYNYCFEQLSSEKSD